GLVREARGRVGVGDVVPRRVVIGGGDGRVGGGVVDLGDARRAHRERAGGDVGGGRGGRVGRVVGRVGAADRDARHRHRLGGAHALVREAGGGRGVGHVVAGHPVVREGHGRVG